MPEPKNTIPHKKTTLLEQIKSLIPREWELENISLDSGARRATLLCFNRPLDDFKEVFNNIYTATGIRTAFHVSCTSIVQDKELVQRVQAALPPGCKIVSLRHKPSPNFYSLESSGEKFSQEELANVRQVLGRPVRIVAPQTKHSPAFGVKDRSAISLNLDLKSAKPSAIQAAKFQVTPFGACEDIGNSCFVLDCYGTRILLDCGSSMRGKKPPPLDLKKIRDVDLVVLSHIHLDHSGMLPWLYETGRCRAPLVLSKPTLRLLPILLHDAYRVSRFDGSKSPYSLGAIAKCLQHAHYLDFHQALPLTGDTSVELIPAGHTLGAVQVLIKTKQQTLLYTGDISAFGTQSLHDARPPPKVDTLFIEATYGDREHIERKVLQTKLLEAVEECCRNGGTVIIPSFAIGRGQEILSILTESTLLGRSSQYKVYADGGMLQRANNTYLRNIDDYGDSHHPFVSRLRRALSPPLGFLTYVESHRRHDLLYDPTPKVIVTTSGMGHGAAQTYIRHYGLDSKNLILFVGYQSPNSVGHSLVNGERTLKFERDLVEVKANVLQISFSGHADSKQLLEYIHAANPSTVVPIHGDTKAVKALGQAAELIIPSTKVIYPSVGQTLDFTLNNN